MAAPVVSLSSRKALDPCLTGGKGASLSRLLRAGFPVPPGFVVTTSAVAAPLNAARRLIVTDGLEAAHRFCLDATLPHRLSRAILRAYGGMGRGSVAVRSSLVCEDTAATSCAGLLETVLGVDGDAGLLDAVRRVLASAFNRRLWVYLDETAGDGERGSLSLAVVVQPVIAGTVSGVAFSVDPVTCRPGVVIEAASGPAEGVVQGRVVPDRFRFGPRGELAEVLPARPGSPCLDEAVARRVANLAASIADFAGTPQDVEWTYDGRTLHILQARPITSLSGKEVYSRRMVSDMAPGVVKPLVWSAKYAPIVENVFAPVFEMLVGSTGVDYGRMLARFYSRVYINDTVFGELFKRIGLPLNFFYVLAREDRAAPATIRPGFRSLPVFFRVARFVRRESRIDGRVEPFLESQRRELKTFETIDWAAEPPEALVGHFRRLKALHGRSQWHVVLVSINMLARSRMLRRMIARRWPDTDPGEVFKGYGRRSSLAPFEEIKKLADDARLLDPGLVARMAAGGGTGLTAALALSGNGRRILDRLDAFMARYGFLSANGSDFSETPWIEDPGPIWSAIGRLAATREPPSIDDAESRREEALHLVRTGYGPVRRRLFDRLHASTIRYMDCRERVSLLMTEESCLMRRCVMALGRKLSERRVIDRCDDIFYLFEEELEPALADTAEAVADRIAARKAEVAGHASFDPPDTLVGGELPAVEPPTAEGLEFLSGIGASAGVLTGRARLVREAGAGGADYGPSEILVVPFTDVGWIPTLAGVGGVVADTGGQLSHTSIIAREFGIPAVVSVRHATRLIRDGQIVTIDGTAGRVYLHPGPS
jgi:pyruvate, water dikinase